MCFSDHATALHVQFYTVQPVPDAVSFPQEGKCLNTGTLCYTSLVLCHLNHYLLHGLDAHAFSSQREETKTEAQARHSALVEFTKEVLLKWQENIYSATLWINGALSFSWARGA